MQIKLISIIFTALILLILPKNCPAQQSLIETITNAKKSLVRIYACQMGKISDKPNIAGISPKSKNLLIYQKQRVRLKQKLGAGVIIDSSGIIITNYHTIVGATHIAIVLSSNKKVFAKILHISPKEDLALLSIQPPYPLKSITFANSNKAKLRQEIIHIGNSEYLNQTISGGRIIGLVQSKSNNNSLELFQLRMDIYKGDSGGPILTRNGNLLGMVSSKLTSQHKTCFAIPTHKILKFCEGFLRNKK